MTTVNKSLAFNGETLIWGGNELLWTEDVYNLHLNQTVGGTIGADKLTGYPGAIVTLSNTALSDYDFDSYSITGSTLTGNQFAFVNSDVTAEALFVPYVPGVSSNLLNDSNVYSGGLSGSFSGGTNYVYYEPFIQIPDRWNYTVLKFKHYGNYVTPTTNLSSIYTRNLSFYFNGIHVSFGSRNSADPNSYMSAMFEGNHKGVWAGPGFTPSTAAKQVSARYYGSTSYVTAYNTWSRNIAENTTGTYRLVIDNNTNDVSSYWGSTYMGSATFSASVSDFRGFNLHQDFGLPYGQTANYNYKIWDIGLSVFNDFNNATAYY